MMNMVERVARAIHQRMKKGGAYKYEYEVDKFSFDILAIAAIEAMREPSEAMIAAADKCHDGSMDCEGLWTRATFESEYTAAIDAALAEGGVE